MELLEPHHPRQRQDWCSACVRLEGENGLDAERWQKIQAAARTSWRATTSGAKSIFTRIREAVAAGEYQKVSDLQLAMAGKMKELTTLYQAYRRNIELA